MSEPKLITHRLTPDTDTTAVDPDGLRFLILKDGTAQTGTDEATTPQITVVLNWHQELLGGCRCRSDATFTRHAARSVRDRLCHRRWGHG